VKVRNVSTSSGTTSRSADDGHRPVDDASAVGPGRALGHQRIEETLSGIP
jgi:hypothetical protein